MTSLLNWTYTYLRFAANEFVTIVGISPNFLSNFSGNLNGPSELLENCQETLVQWFSYDDFQFKLLKGFLVLLVINVVLILLSWKVYGKRIYETFMKPVTPKVIEDLKKSVSQLKLPKEHSPRV